MKSLWYLIVKYSTRLGFFFYYKKVFLKNVANVPANKAILFVANHQNALIDPLLIGAFTPRTLHFLTRGDIFNKPLVRKLLSTVNMMPIYRIRDGRDGLSKNDAVFRQCYEILNKNGTVLIFPEGNHNIQRRIRPVSKGFSRIVFGALQRDPSTEIVILPIGINYSNAKRYGSSVCLNYGKEISVNKLWQLKELDEKVATIKLIEAVSQQLKKLVTHIDDVENHDRIQACFQEDDFLDPDKVNEKIKQGIDIDKPVQHPTASFNFLMPLVKTNSILPIAIWQWFYPKIDEEEFIATFKFSMGISLFPIFYLLQSAVVGHFFGLKTALIYLAFSFISMYLLTKSR